ncbi:MAG TPA: OB-fold domain-containing protein [Thermoplasmata archaeon]|nr:OB-fold domain-containing protein [Thermoplasmata archaeon]
MCGKRDLADVTLSGRGNVVAFSIQHVPSDEFLNDAPYAYVVVELEEGGRITGWMESVKTASDLSIGDHVEWVASYTPGVHFQKPASSGSGSA